MKAFWKNQSAGVQDQGNRRGSMVTFAAISMVMLFAMVAFTIDVGMIALTDARLQKNADAAALAAAQQLSGVLDPATVRTNARAAAQAVYVANVGGNPNNANFDPALDVAFGQTTWNAQTQQYTYHWGDQFTPYNMVKVFGRRVVRAPPPGSSLPVDQRLPLYFAPVLGQNSAAIENVAVASFQPRDIMLVLDFSRSMCYDSQFYRLGMLSQSQIETSLSNIWQDLGSPVYGSLTYSPRFLKFEGVPATSTIPHCTVTWKGTKVDVTSTKGIVKVRLKYSNNSAQTFTGSGQAGTFQGTGSNAGLEIVSAWVLSGGNTNLSSGGYGEQFSFANTNIISNLGLTNVAYPYPSGSWNEFVDYCTGGSQDIIDAGYKYKFGAMLWVNYLQEVHASYAETPDLWKVREMPTAILKNGVNTFADYLTSSQCDDQVGLSIYSTSTSSGAILEAGLSKNVSNVKTLVQHRQAGHYDPYTNIGMGMQLARLELTNNARPRAFRLMVVMTDGVVNRPTNATVGQALVISEANAAAAAKIKVLTISMGVMADVNLMQQVADITGGINFVVPGGADTATYEQQMLDTFKTIAASRPLKLIGGK